MKYCKTCNVHYDTPIEHCLFCHGDLTDDNQESTYKFSTITNKKRFSQWLKIFLILNIGSIFISLALDFFNGFTITWSFTVSVANVSAIVLALMFFSHTVWSTKLSKLLITTIVGVFLIGLSLRDYQWAVDYVFPSIIVIQMMILSSLILFNHKKWLDLSSNLLTLAIIGLFPGLLFFLDITEVNWPSIVCVSYAFITLLGIFMLPSKENREELKSRFHI
ncbi:MAG: DUF6320 domain-containing protein [Acholeplasmataceae bacterium]